MSAWIDKLNGWVGQFLGWLLGVRDVRANELTNFSIFWDNKAASVGLFVLAAAGAVVLAVLASRREQRHLGMWRRGVLGVLRAAALLMAVLLVFLPFVKFSYVQRSARPLVVLLDNSDSMNIKDVRIKEEDLTAAAKVLVGPEELARRGPVSKWPAEERERVKRVSRAALVRQLFESDAGTPFFEGIKGFDVRVFFVGDEVKRVEPRAFGGDLAKLCGSLTFTEKSSAIGNAIRDSIKSYYGQAPYAVLYVGDGRSNKGLSLESAATTASAAGTRVYVVAAGVEKAKDVQIEYVDANDVLFKDDKAIFRTVLSQADCDGERCDLVLKLNGRVVYTKPVNLSGPTQTVDIEYVPTEVTGKGQIDSYEISAEGVADEIDMANNVATKKCRTIDGKLKVLYVEDYPRWEWRVMRDMLMKDRRVGEGNYKTLLRKADERMLSKHPYYLREFPSANELKEYHALIIGDVDARDFSPKDIEAIHAFVADWGGGLMMIAGDQYNPGSYTGKSNELIEEMMPVLYRPTPSRTLEDETEQPLSKGFNVKLTPWAATYSFTAFDPDPRQNQKIWHDFGPFYWHADVRRLHPMAVPLLVSDAEKDEEGRALPLIALRRYGKGCVIFVGIDETWRFRKEIGSLYHRTFWEQAVQYLGVSLLSGSTRRIELRLEKKRATVDEKVEVEAAVFDQNYQPLLAEEVGIKYQRQGGEVHELKLIRSAREEQYRGTFQPKEEGDYVFWIEDRFAAEPARLERFLSVRQPNVERDNPTADVPRLTRLAEETGGKLWQLNQLEELRTELASVPPLTNVRTVQRLLWNSWLAFCLLIGCLTVEWSLRKWWHLR